MCLGGRCESVRGDEAGGVWSGEACSECGCVCAGRSGWGGFKSENGFDKEMWLVGLDDVGDMVLFLSRER